ncbi:MAG: RNA polymerase subunit sigma [Bdellovibrio sp. CG10_big_fil_rev_8_21_14_0_10_47_8]|nr:MAG: RNA polymerase subunit sigma [Bdellovibrio sp. CG10_big_fil_rev_8_21_14_0_10_47_8]
MAKTLKKKSITKSPAKGAKKKSAKPKVTKKTAARKVTHKRVVAELVDDSAVSNTDHDDEISPVVDDSAEVSDTAPDLTPSSPTDKSLTTADPVGLYLAEIRKYPLLSREQESELAKKYYETKDPAMAQALVTANLRFVVKVAAEYSRFGARMIDLIQEGNMGLMHAVRDFNPYKGVRLITYAVWWIRGYIQEYLMKQYSLVKIGTTQNQKKLFYQLQRQRQELDALGQTPDIQLLSTRLGIPADEVQMMTQRMSGRDISLDRPMSDDSSASLMDLQRGEVSMPDEALAQHEELSQLTEAINELKPHLSAREKIILEERILNDEPLTLQEIGEKYGITREAVRQMEARLMKKIKDQFER